MPGYTLTRHRGKYAVTFKDGERRVRISTGTADRGLAEARARAIWDRRNAPPGERVADIWPAYVADRVRDGVSETRLADNWRRLEPFFGHRLGQALTREDCRSYAAQRRAEGYSDSTSKTDLEMLRACLRWHYGQDAPNIWVGHGARPRDRWLTKDEARRVVDLADTPHVKLFVVLALTTGARAGAILDLTWGRVDFTHGTIDYRPAGRAQTNKRRTTVPMNALARDALLEAYRGRLTDHVIEYGGKPVASVKKSVQRLSQRAGIPFSPHTLRHTCAVWMAQADVPMQKIAQYLGHTSTRVTEGVYARYSPSYMRDASEAATF